MEKTNPNERRNFLKTAGAALLAASVPASVAAQKASDGRPSAANNQKQLLIFGGVSEPLPNLPGPWGKASYHFQMRMNLDGTDGFGTIFDPVVSSINSHIKFRSGRAMKDVFLLQGEVQSSTDPNLVGKGVTLKIQQLPGDNCDLWITIAGTPVSGLLLPAVQKVRD